MKQIGDVRLKDEDRRAIAEAVEVLQKSLPVAQVVLFGSKSRGDDDPESDIDLLVLTHRPVSRAERHAAVDALFDIQLRHDVVLSPLVVAAEEWRAGMLSALPIHDEVEEHGVIV